MINKKHKVLKRLFFVLLAFLVSFSDCFAEGEYVPGEVLVRLKNYPSGTLMTKAVCLRTFTCLNLKQVKVPAGETVESYLEKLRKDPAVLYAEPNYKIKKAIFPNDTYFGKQWGLTNISAPVAWEITQGGNIIVAVIDSGIDYTHQDLVSNLWVNPGEVPGNGIDDDNNGYIDDIYGINIVAGNGDPMDDDSDSHGTHVAGIIGAVGNNGVGISGVAWQVKLMAVKVLDNTGWGNVADVVEGISYAIEHGARILNASWTLENYSQALKDILAEADKKGILCVTAAGNEGRDNDKRPVYPASFNLDNIIAVAASDDENVLSTFSNYGTTTVDVAAPGVDIYSTIRNNDYGFLSGTSMATAFVSGTAALIWCYNPVLSQYEVKGKIINGVDRFPSLEEKLISGGRVNVYNSLTNSLTPSLFNIQPSTVYPEETITLTGVNFGTGGEVVFGGTLSGTTSEWADRFISVKVPAAAVSGKVTVKTSEGESNGFYLRVLVKSPSNLTARSLSTNQVEIRWEDNSTNENGFRIERKTDTIPYSQIAETNPNTTVYTDEGLVPDTTYYYRVRAYNTSENSDYSNEAIITTPSLPREKDIPCFIATAAFGSPLERSVRILREFRDRFLLTNHMGRTFVSWYYRHSPKYAGIIAKSETLKAMTRVALLPLIGIAYLFVKGLFFYLVFGLGMLILTRVRR